MGCLSHEGDYMRKYLNYIHYLEKVKELDDIYWTETAEKRWEYIHVVLSQLKVMKPKTILELGSNNINLTTFSDNMCLKKDDIDVENMMNRKYIQDALKMPWKAIRKKQYDVFIALQVFEHLRGKQAEVFKQIQRVSNTAILSFPFEWEYADFIHTGITKNTINKWTCGMRPEEIIVLGDNPNRRRAIYIFKFNK